MKTLKKIGIGLFVIVLLLVILGLFVISPKTHVEASRSFNVPAPYVFNLLNDLKNVDLYNYWVLEDEDMKLTYGENTVGKNASYSWISPTSGSGKISYIKSVPFDSIVGEMQFEDMTPATITYLIKDKGSSTNLTWMMDTELGFPYNLMKWIMKYQVKSSYEKSFDAMEKVLQSRKVGKYRGYEVTTSLRPETHYLMSRSEVAFDNTQKYYTQNLAAIFQRIQNEGVVMQGATSGLFFKKDYDKGTVDMAAALPINEAIEMEGLTSLTTPSSQVVTVDYYGNYDNTQKAHDAIKAYLGDRMLIYDVPVIEEYVTDPIKEKDPANWLTRIVYFIADKN